jgi:transposase-like protein
MDAFDGSDSHRGVSSPPKCPSCKSASVTTTAKSPNANSYWRCEQCGEIWNIGRRHEVSPRGIPWR